MNMQPVVGSDTWAQFLKLSNQARVRNAGFDLPLTPNKTIGSKENKKRSQEIMSGIPQAGRLYDASETQTKRQSIIGTRFDAYA